MLKIYMRLLGFARPIQKYAIPYFFYSLLYALFNSLTFLLIMPILNTMFCLLYTSPIPRDPKTSSMPSSA